MNCGEPTGYKENAHVYHFAVDYGNLYQVEDVQLRGIPIGEQVVAVGHVGDGKATI